MKVNVRVHSEWFVLPVKPEQTVQEVCELALHRHDQLQSEYANISTDVGLHEIDENLITKAPSSECLFEVRKNATNAILHLKDLAMNALDENDFLVMVFRDDELEADVDIVNVTNEIRNLHVKKTKNILLDGHTLQPEDLLKLGYGEYQIELTEAAWKAVKEGRDLLENLITDNKVVYGINTGFGKFANTIIDKSELKQLQRNLIRSHSSGVGRPLPIERVRRLLALRINVLAKGHSGISPKTVRQLLDAFNADCLSWVPEQGTVGASGDLAPLAHLALGLMGEGKMWSPKTGWSSAALVLKAHGLAPIDLNPKEGIALINGTQLITSLGAEAVVKAQQIAEQADIVAALSLEVLKGTTRAFDADIHDVRPHSGQKRVAETLRALLHSDVFRSGFAESHRFCNKVQDAYTIRCCPQVHGISHETIRFVRDVIQVEMNSATDNPLIFAKRSECISGGNFHGEYPAKACDYLAIGVHELASMSERRIERLVNPALSGLPAFLVENGGLNSGFMMPHCTAAALVSENKVLCHPASIDSLSTSAGTEDHVSMGGFAARKAVAVVENVEKVIAIELLAACQAIEFLRPLKTTEPLEEVYNLVRSVVKPLEIDRFMAPEIEKVVQLLRENRVYKVVRPYISIYKNKIKEMSKKQMEPERPSSPTTTFSNTHCRTCRGKFRN